jgi:hypothetical protein
VFVVTIWLLYALLVLTLVAVGSIIASYLRLGAVPMPSSRAVRRAVVDEVARHPGCRAIVDLGSGWGGLTKALARAYPDRQVAGYEASLVPYLVSRALARRAGNLRVRRVDFRSLRPATETLYVCYLSPETMNAVQVFFERARAPCVLISVFFAIRGREPDRVVAAGDLHGTQLFVYEAPERRERLVVGPG